MPYCHEWDEKKEVPKHVFLEAAKAGIFNSLTFKANPKYFEYPWPVPIDNFDGFHAFIVSDEMSRCGSGGVMWALLGGLGFI